MASFDTFDLGKVLQVAQALDAGKRQSTMDGLRTKYMANQDAREAQSAALANQGAQTQLDANTAKMRYLQANAIISSDNPHDDAKQFAPEFVQMYEQKNGPGSFDQAAPEQIKQIAQAAKGHFAAAAGIQAPSTPTASQVGGFNVLQQDGKVIEAAAQKPDETFSPQTLSDGSIVLVGNRGSIKRDTGLQGKDPSAMTQYQAAQLKLEKDKLNAANNPMGIGQPSQGQQPGQGQQAGTTGNDFLKTLPNSSIADQVKALAEGRMPWPSGMALKTPYWQQMLSAVSQYDPSFDAINYSARSKTRNDFTSGKGAMNIKALNTAIGHLGTLSDQVAGTASHDFTPLNYLQNKGAEASGSSGPTLFKQTASALASELTQVFRGSGGAEADIKRYLDELNVNGSQEQKTAAIKNIATLLHSRTAAIGDQYNQGMGTTADPLTLLNPTAQGVLKHLSDSNSAAPTKTATGPNGQKLGLINGQWVPLNGQ